VPVQAGGDPGDAFLELELAEPRRHLVDELARTKLPMHRCQLAGEGGDLVPVEQQILQQDLRRAHR
jgi:hypothetical protein